MFVRIFEQQRSANDGADELTSGVSGMRRKVSCRPTGGAALPELGTIPSSSSHRTQSSQLRTSRGPRRRLPGRRLLQGGRGVSYLMKATTATKASPMVASTQPVTLRLHTPTSRSALRPGIDEMPGFGCGDTMGGTLSQQQSSKRRALGSLRRILILRSRTSTKLRITRGGACARLRSVLGTAEAEAILRRFTDPAPNTPPTRPS